MLGGAHGRKCDGEGDYSQSWRRLAVSLGWGGHTGRSRRSKTESEIGPGACAFVRVYGGVLCGFQAKAGLVNPKTRLEFW